MKRRKANMRDRLKLHPKLASRFARLGGIARAAKLSPDERTAGARKAGLARQAKRREGQPASTALIEHAGHAGLATVLDAVDDVENTKGPES